MAMNFYIIIGAFIFIQLIVIKVSEETTANSTSTNTTNSGNNTNSTNDTLSNFTYTYVFQRRVIDQFDDPYLWIDNGTLYTDDSHETITYPYHNLRTFLLEAPETNYCGQKLTHALCVICKGSFKKYVYQHSLQTPLLHEMLGSADQHRINEDCCFKKCFASRIARYCGSPNPSIDLSLIDCEYPIETRNPHPNCEHERSFYDSLRRKFDKPCHTKKDKKRVQLERNVK